MYANPGERHSEYPNLCMDRWRAIIFPWGQEADEIKVDAHHLLRGYSCIFINFSVSVLTSVDTPAKSQSIAS